MRLRRRLKIKALDRISKRQKAFTRRCSDLINGTKRLSEMADEKSGIIVLSKGGKAYGFGHPLVGEFCDRRYPTIPCADRPPTEAQRRVREALAEEEPAWDEVAKGLSLSDICQMEAEMVRIQHLLERRERELGANDDEVFDPTSVLNF